MAKSFIKAIFRHPKATLGITLLLFCFLGTGIITSYRTDMSPTVWFEKDYPGLQDFRQFEDDFGNDDSIILAIHNPSGLLNKESLQLIEHLTDKFWQLKDIIRVDSLTNYQWVHSSESEIKIEPLFSSENSTESFQRRIETAKKDPTIKGYLLNKEATTTLLYGKLKPGFEGQLHHTSVYDDTLKLVEDAKKASGHQFYVGGIAATHGALDHLVYRDFFTVTPILVLSISIIIYWLFQSLVAAAIVLLVVLCSIISTLGFACWVGIPIDPMTSSMPQILVAIGVADSMHVLSSFFMYLRRSSSVARALYKALLKNLKPTLMTTITTIVGFLSLYSSGIVPIKRLGLLVAAGGTLAWFFTFALSTSLILFFSSQLKSKIKERLVITDSFSERFVTWLERNKWAVIITFVALSLSGIALTTRNIVDSDPGRYLHNDHYVSKSGRFISDQIGSTTVLEIVVDSGTPDGVKDPAFLKQVEKFSNWVSKHRNVTKVVGALDIVKDVNKALNNDNPQYRSIPEQQSQVAEALFLYGLSVPPGMDLNFWITIDYSKLRLSTWWNVTSTEETLKTLNEFQAKADELGLNIKQTGKGGLTSNLGPLTVSTFFRSIFLTLIFVFLLMTFLLKSLKLGLISMLPNVIPLAIGGGIMYLIGFPLDIGTAIVTAICLGIAVDDTIHILEEFRRYQVLGYSTERSLSLCFQHSGRAIFLTTILLSIGFMSFTAGQFVPTVEFGIMNAIVISLALATDIWLLPVILLLMKKESKKTESVE